MENGVEQQDFDERRQFEDRPVGDRQPGPARAVDISGRCGDCWGAVSGTKDAAGRWIRIECLVCGRSVDGDEAAGEADAMRREAEGNMAAGRIGRPSKYRSDAAFVLKLLPDMDRDKEKVDQRIEASLAEGPKPKRLARNEIGPAGQATCTLRRGCSWLA